MGLLALLVFIAFPALQRQQRETERRDNMTYALSQFTQYRVNNARKLPQSDEELNGTFLNNYIVVNDVQEFEDPGGKPYRFVLDVNEGTEHIEDDVGGAAESVRIWYYPNAKCAEGSMDVEELGPPGALNGQAALRYFAENGVICMSEI